MKNDIQRNNRESNIELLRIVAMLLIVLHHITWHCFLPQLTSNVYISYFNNGVFNTPFFFKKLLIPVSFVPFGKTGVAIFMIISGYFLVERKQGANILHVSKKLLLQVAFAVFFLVFASFILFQIFRDTRTIGSLLEIDLYNNSFWFAGYYYLIMLLGSLFLNKTIMRFSQQQYLTVLVVLFAVFSFSWSGALFDDLADGLRSLMAGVFCYMWGGYCKKYNPLNKIRTIIVIVLILILFGFLTIIQQ